MTDSDSGSLQNRRICLWLGLAISALHLVTLVVLARITPLTSDENHYLAGGIALRHALVFEPHGTILQGPLVYFGNQLTSWFGAGFDFPYDITFRNKVNGRYGMLLFSMLSLVVLLRLAWRTLGPRASVAAGVISVLTLAVLRICRFSCHYRQRHDTDQPQSHTRNHFSIQRDHDFPPVKAQNHHRPRMDRPTPIRSRRLPL